MEDSNLRSTIADNVKDSEHVNSSEEKEKVETTQPPPKPVEETKVEEKKEEGETFSKRIDPKGLSPEKLDEIYQGYNKAYTQRRQKEKEEMRKYQEEIASLREQVAKVEKKAENIDSPDLKEEKRQLEEDFDLGKLSLKEYTIKLREIMREDARRVAKEEFNSMFKSKTDEEYKNQALATFNTLDERFDQRFVNPDSPEFNETNAWMYQNIAGQMSEKLDDYIAKNGTSVGFNTKEEAEKLIKAFDSRIDNIVKNRVKANTQVAKEKATKFQKSALSGKTVNSVTEQSKDLRKSIEENLQ